MPAVPTGCLALPPPCQQLEPSPAGPLSSCRPRSFLSHLFFWNVLPDSAPPLRLLLSVLKYQSLPYEVRRATPVSVRQGNIGISSVFGVRISLFSSLSAGPSQINSRWELTAHSFRTHSFQKSSMQWSTPGESPAIFVAQVLPLASW